MKSKSFRGENSAAIIRAVNDWLAGETGVRVQRTQTTPADPKPGERIEFCVWYEQDGAAR